MPIDDAASDDQGSQPASRSPSTPPDASPQRQRPLAGGGRGDFQKKPDEAVVAPQWKGSWEMALKLNSNQVGLTGLLKEGIKVRDAAAMGAGWTDVSEGWGAGCAMPLL